MTDDDLTRRLEAWAAATVPDGDPVTAEEVDAATDVALPRPTPGGLRRRRGLAIAAAVLALLGLASALAVTTRDGPAELVTDAPGAPGPRSQVIVVADWDDGDTPRTHRFTLHEACAPPEECVAEATVASGPLLEGTSLVAHVPLPAGAWVLRYETDGCTDEGCGPIGPDGAPEAGGDHPLRCDVGLPSDGVARRFVVRISHPADDLATCTLDTTTSSDPVLTIPPAWSVREPLPWSCGTATHDINAQVPSDDAAGAVVGLTCFRAAIADGSPAEIPVTEPQENDGLTRSWWRALPEPVDGHPVEVIRARDLDGATVWARVRCDDIAFESREIEREEMSWLHVDAHPVDCTDEEPLSLDLPALDGVAPAAAGAIDVVVDGRGLQDSSPPTRWRWTVAIDDREVADTVVVGDEVEQGEWGPVALLADDLDVPAGARTVTVTASDESGRTLPSSCSVDVTAGVDGAVLMAGPGGRSCTYRWEQELPVLTVPPRWTARTPATACVDLAPDARWGTCLADVAEAGNGEVAEWTEHEGGVLTTYRVEGSSVAAVTVVRRLVHPGGVTWTSQSCFGLDPGADGRSVSPDRCDPEEQQLPLTP